MQTCTASQPAPRSALPPIAGDPMADRLDPPELLGVDVEQLARPLTLVAHDRRLRLERRQLAEPEAAQTAADRRDRHGQSWRAIAGPLRRCRRQRSISATRAAGTSCRQCLGAELRSTSAASPAGAIAREPAVSLPFATVPPHRRPTPPSSPGPSPAAPAGVDLGASNAHSCACSSGRSPAQACDCGKAAA